MQQFHGARFTGGNAPSTTRARPVRLCWWLAAAAAVVLGVTPLSATQIRVRDGQMVRLKLHSVLTTENVVKGDPVDFDVAEDVIVNGHQVIAKGAVARGKVVRVKGAGKKRAKDAAVTFEFVSVRAVDGQEVPLRASPTKPKKRDSKQNEIEEGSPISGYTERVIGAEKGKEYAAYTDGSMIVNGLEVTPAAAAAPARTTPASAAPQTATRPAASAATAAPLLLAPEPAAVEFSSDPTGADILIDGSFVGNTPSTLRVTPGRHAIEIRLAGYQSWTRTMVVDPDSHPTVRATLSKE